MKKILAVAFLIMVFVGLWLAILGHIEASRSFGVMVVVGLLVSVLLSVVTNTNKWTIISGKVIGVVDSKDAAKEALSVLSGDDCFAIATRGLSTFRADEDAP